MQGDEAARKAIALELGHIALGRVKRMGINPLRAQRLQHALARHE